MKKALLSHVGSNPDYRYLANTSAYACCGAGTWSGFQNNPFHTYSDQTLVGFGAKRNYGYMLDVVAPVEQMNKVWEWEGWEPRTWHKQLRDAGFTLVAVFDGWYQSEPTQLAYYHLNTVPKEI